VAIGVLTWLCCDSVLNLDGTWRGFDTFFAFATFR